MNRTNKVFLTKKEFINVFKVKKIDFEIYSDKDMDYALTLLPPLFGEYNNNDKKTEYGIKKNYKKVISKTKFGEFIKISSSELIYEFIKVLHTKLTTLSNKFDRIINIKISKRFHIFEDKIIKLRLTTFTNIIEFTIETKKIVEGFYIENSKETDYTINTSVYENNLDGLPIEPDNYFNLTAHILDIFTFNPLIFKDYDKGIRQSIELIKNYPEKYIDKKLIKDLIFMDFTVVITQKGIIDNKVNSRTNDYTYNEILYRLTLLFKLIFDDIKIESYKDYYSESESEQFSLNNLDYDVLSNLFYINNIYQMDINKDFINTDVYFSINKTITVKDRVDGFLNVFGI